ncbi:MAG: synthase protein [Nocardioidaceae bacterium]|jgi:F0F1-type ATP synthase assembly protein I|nr:synthase protein [Nocardioidaceae bacterium]
MVDEKDRAPDPSLSGRDLAGLGGVLVAAVVGGLVLGLLLDSWWGTDPVFALVGVFVGIAVGCLVFFLRVRSALRP